MVSGLNFIPSRMDSLEHMKNSVHAPQAVYGTTPASVSTDREAPPAVRRPSFLLLRTEANLAGEVAWGGWGGWGGGQFPDVWGGGVRVRGRGG